MKWYGVMPAITTCFDEHLHVDHGFTTRHVQWLLANGCTGIITLGSLGEAATLTLAEKEAVIRNVIAAAKQAPVVAAISSLSTDESVALAKTAEQAGCSGLMVLPPYVYRGDWREMKAYVSAVFRATPLSCMLYNNPVSYGTDFLPEQIAELAAEYSNFAAVKESSTDVRRVTAIRALTAFPAESVALFDAAIAGRHEEAFALYRWFLPLLRMDTVPKFIQLIKQVQQEIGVGNARVRPPRLEVIGAELQETRAAVQHALQHQPVVKSSAFPK